MPTTAPCRRFAVEPLEPRQLFAGDFDPTFGGGDGFQSITFPAQFQLNAIFDSALQPDGKTILSGRVDDGLGDGGFDFAVARLNPDGSPDASFANGGIFTIPFPGLDDRATGVALQSDGKVVVVGQISTGTGENNFVVMRLDQSGNLDPTFGANVAYSPVPGIVNPNLTRVDFFGNFQTPEDDARDVVIQPDGKIVVAGAAGKGDGSGGQYLAVARFNPDGSLDGSFGNLNSFGTGHIGFATVTLGGDVDVALGVALQPDGKVIATGTSATTLTGDVHYITVRLDTDGLLDSTFGFGGLATSSFPTFGPYFASFSLATNVATQPDGKVLVAGFVIDVGFTSFDFDIGLARYNPDGSPDFSFGNGTGIVQTDFGFFEAPSSILFQSDGKIVISGKATASAAAPVTFNIAVIARYNSDGSLDNTFSGDGKVVVLPNQFGTLAATPARPPDGLNPAPFLSAALITIDDATPGNFQGFAQSSNTTVQMVQGGGIRAQFVLGQALNEFQLTGDAPVTATAGDLVISFVPLGRSYDVGEGGAVTVTISNYGPTPVTGNPVVVILFSTDAIVDNNDVGLAQANVPVTLAPGASAQTTLNFTTPAGAAAGNYAMVARVNGDRLVGESNFDNNDAATTFPVTVPQPPPPPTLGATLKGGGKIKRGKAAKFTVQLNNLTQLLLQGTAVLAFQVTDTAGQNPTSGGPGKSQKLKLKKGKNQKVNVSFKVPKTLAPGTYTYHVTVDATHLSSPTANPITLTTNFTVV